MEKEYLCGRTIKKEWIMKKISTLCIALCTVMATTVLSSCDDDLSRAMTLSGEWRGDFGMFYEYE